MIEKTPSGYFRVDGLPIVFSKKPPEWIVPFLFKIYDSGFSKGEEKYKAKIRDLVEFMFEERDD